MALKGRKKPKNMQNGEIIVLDNVVKSDKSGSPALNGVSLKIKKGEFVFLVVTVVRVSQHLLSFCLRSLTPHQEISM